MTTFDSYATSCVEVLNALVALIDGEIEETIQIQSIQTHVQECTPCRTEIDHERKVQELLQNLLTRSCCESAPQDLHDSIAAITHPVTSIITEFSMTEVSIEIDEFGQVEHREITIERTQEFRLPPQE